MLVLTRKKNEEIVIGDNIRVKVLEVRGERVRLGIIAPLEIPVHRSEVHQRINNATHADELANNQQNSETLFNAAQDQLLSC